MLKRICDRCGYTEDMDVQETITRVNFYCIAASQKPHERSERETHFDLCENCRALLPDLYDKLMDYVENQVCTWCKENKE